MVSGHLSKVGVRINGIASGLSATSQNKNLFLNNEGSHNGRTRKILNSTPINRYGKLETLIGTLLFLVNEGASSFINAVIIPVDRRFSAHSKV